MVPATSIKPFSTPWSAHNLLLESVLPCRERTMIIIGNMRFLIVFVFTSCVFLNCVRCSDFQQEFRLLSKQVQVLFNKRTEDMKMIEENIRKTIYDSAEMDQMREEIKFLRTEIARLNSGKIPKSEQGKNDILTMKWLYNGLNEVKAEINEIQASINSSSILEKQENTEVTLKLLKSDIADINSEMENARVNNAKYEADLDIMCQEFKAIKESLKSTAEMCGKTKNQLKALQMEWNQNWKILNEKSPALENESTSTPSRHHKIIKKHIIRLEKGARTLHKENYFLKTRIMELEDVIKNLNTELKSTQNTILANEIVPQTEVVPQPESINEESLSRITNQQQINNNAIKNLTSRVADLDKLHMSFLELLENVETIESKIDKSFPEYRKEISKLEVQSAESVAGVSLLKEDQKNIIKSLKAISFSVSNIQDKTAEDRQKLKQVESTVNNLIKSNSVQTSKLHDHILKEESSSISLNATKSTIHLVQELRSFENEYKSIVNKLPRDCNTVEGPKGIYLISPGDGEPILAHCDNGWTTVQKRYDGSLDFNRKWNEYSNGFGSATGEHWLGNKNLHLLTRENCSQLQINMKDIYGNYWQANYEDFRVADFDMGFKLSISRFNGNASDALAYQNLMEFSTVDNDRDISNNHCASNYEGGWWFSHCQHANLNGRYNLGLTWFDNKRNEWIAVATSEMKVKRRSVC